MSLKPSVANPQLHLGSPELTRHKPEPDPDNKDKKSSSVITVLIAIGANFLIAIAKSVAAFITGSASMVAEAAHSWADTGNGVFLLVAEKKAVKPADKSHPLGYGKEAYVWSMIA
ncbi:MAG: cation transporter, partial [Psychrobacter sp.]|nr:cation transporter [Psychrobacter sp.]